MTRIPDGWAFLRCVVCAAAIVFMIAPLIIVLIISFSSAPFLTFPPPGFSLQWYANALENPAWLRSIKTSFQIVVPTALMATALGTAAALALTRARLPGAGWISGLLMAPLAMPVIITAAAVFGVFQSWNLYGSKTGLILAHTVLTLPYVLATVGSSLRLVDPRLEDAARSLGAGPWRVFYKITLPLILPAVLSGLLFAMVVSFDELVVSLFISTPTVRPVTVQMWSNIRGDVDPTIAAIAALLFAFSFAVLLLENLSRRRQGKQGIRQERLNFPT